MHTNKSFPHFENKDALGHVVDKRIEGTLASSEIHGTEMPGTISAACDSAKETVVILFILLHLWTNFFPTIPLFNIMIIFSVGWILWKGGRSTLLGWSYLERIHLITSQERWEIKHQRKQEKEELVALYQAKGLKGKLLEDVVEVFMADDERLLKIMIEEELGLTTEALEHPLKQGLSSMISALSTILFFYLAIFFPYGIYIAPFIVFSISSFYSAYLSNNQILPFMIWNLALLTLLMGTVHIITQALH